MDGWGYALNLILALFFLVAGIALGAAALTGYRGQVCDRLTGYTVPARVAEDPDLCREANELVRFWCTGGAVLCVPPVLILLFRVGNGWSALSLWELAACVVYLVALGSVSLYPFERIKTLADQN